MTSHTPMSDEIERHIDGKREDLGRNLDDLEEKVRSAMDWRSHFDKNPGLFVGLAFLGGIAVSAMTTSRTITVSPRLSRSWGALQGAAVGAVLAKAEDFLDRTIPGFRKEYDAGGGYKN